MNMTSPDPVDLDFISTRHKLLDVAAFLDRVERSGISDDFRVEALKAALPLLQKDGGQRTRNILESFSDTTSHPIESAHTQGACGAVPPGEAS